MAGGTLDPEQGVVRWAWGRTKVRLAHWLVGTLVVSLVVGAIGGLIGLPEHPTTGDRIVQGLVVALAAFGVLTLFVFALSLLRAPYEQRDALRVLVAKQSSPLSPLRSGVGGLKIKPQWDKGRFWFDITNEGDPGWFSAQIIVPNQPPENCRWHVPKGDKPTEFHLAQGKFAQLQPPYHPHNKAFTIRFMSREGAPVDRFYETRRTMLGSAQFRVIPDPWPERDDAWRKRVEEAVPDFVALQESLDAIADDDYDAADRIIREALDVLPAHELEGNRFSGNLQNLNLDLTRRFGGSAEDHPVEHVDGYRRLLGEWIGILSQVRGQGNDDPIAAAP